MLRVSSALVSLLTLGLLFGCTDAEEETGADKEKGTEAKGTPAGETKSPPAAGEEPEAKPADAKTAEKKAAQPPGTPSPALLDPGLAKERAPDKFKVKMTTTKGDFVIEVTRDWSPNGADRLYNLVKIGYYTDVAFFRVIGGFMAQFGIHGDPAVSRKWRAASIPDDPVKQSNKRGYVTYAMGGPNSRTTQLFINFADNSRLDGMGFPPVGVVVEGMDVVDSIYSGYGGGPDEGGRGPTQQRAQLEGNKYLKASFPRLDYIQSATIVE